jgi:ubiquinol-cytochrome c reductase cytochrome c subunit
MAGRRRLLLPGALAAFVAAAGVFFLASSSGSVARAQTAGTGAGAASGASLPASSAPGATPGVATPAAPSTSSPTTSTPTTSAAPAPTIAASRGQRVLQDPTIKLPKSLVPEGRVLFIDNCSSCHGTNAAGSSRAPNLLGLGAATVDFWVSTGRMPLAEPTQQAVVKPPRFNERQTHAIAAYVDSLLPGGPGIPAVDTAHADQGNGGNLFAINCAGCHTITGVGDALSAGAYAPSLYAATPTQIYEAVRIGPGQMPRFSPQQLSPAQVNDLVSYVRYLHHASDPGGAGLGHVGPVTEGFIGLLLGVGALMLVAFWLGDRA